MYSGSAQQDAQEFLRYLLEALHGAINTGGQKVSLHIDDEMRLVWMNYDKRSFKRHLFLFSSDLEKANEMWNWYNKREASLIKDLFVGQLKSSLHCTYCEKTSVMYDPFWDLSGWLFTCQVLFFILINLWCISVPVPSSPNCKLDKCLEMFTVKDVLDGNEMPYCDVSCVDA